VHFTNVTCGLNAAPGPTATLNKVFVLAFSFVSLLLWSSLLLLLLLFLLLLMLIVSIIKAATSNASKATIEYG